jgi:hypothetical protein
MASENSRSADASIAGYLYQFDKSILEVLKASDESTVVLEGYEDVDLRNLGAIVAIQCKYHESGTFSLKKIRDPLLAMLKTFDEGHKFQYRLYGHYGQQVDEIPKTLTLKELKEALTKEGKKETTRYYEGFSTETLLDFIDHFEIIDGPSRSSQRDAVLTKLQSLFGGSVADSSDLYYPNAISIVLDIAAHPEEEVRTVQRATFVESLDKRKDLFTRWHRELLGSDRYLKSVERQIKSLGLVKSTFRRMVILGSAELSSASATTRLTDLIKEIAGLKFGIGYLSKAKQWSVVLEAGPERLAEIKESLIRDGVIFGDGFEHLLFSTDIFNRPAIINTGSQNKKISAVSDDLKLVGLSTVETHIADLATPDVVLCFREEPVELPWGGQPPRELNVAGCDLDQLAELVGRLA